MHFLLAIFIIALILYIRAGFRQIANHERLIVYRDGSKPFVRGPGRAFVLPLIGQSRLMDLSVQTVSLQGFNLFGQMQMSMDLRFQYQIVDPVKAAAYKDPNKETVAAVKRALDEVFSLACLRDCLREMYVLESLTIDAATTELKSMGIKVTSLNVETFAFSKRVLASLVGVSDRIIANLCWAIGELHLPGTASDFIA